MTRYTTREVSERLGRSHQLVNYWAKRTGVKRVGMVRKFYSFTEEDIEILKIKLKLK